MTLAHRERWTDRKNATHISRSRCGGDTGFGADVSGTRADRSFEDLFIHSLVAAGSCRQHRKENGSCRSTKGTSFTRLERKSLNATQKRWLSSQPPKKNSAAAAAELPSLPEISNDEYKELVNTYPEFEDKRELQRHEKSHYPLAPRLVMTPFEELSLTPGSREVLSPEDDQHAAELKRFTYHLWKPLGHISHEKLWNMYQNLRSPRPRYLDDATFARFFRQLSWIMFKDSEVTMRRYFALLNECIGERVCLSRAIWNDAIHFAGRWLRHATSNEVKVAVETWMRMENAGYQADKVTFNILFGVAVRAGRYALADTIYAELRARDLTIDRYFRASMIHYAGVKRDGDGVRQAFRDLVDAGEVVDTAVMNCVILSLIRSGEPAAAENVFYRMKALHEQKFGVAALRDWRKARELAQILNRTGRQLRKQKEHHEASFFGGAFSADEQRERIQKVTPIAPNASTYALLIKHHAYTSGNLDEIRALLEEMTQNDHHVHGSVYVHLLRGFWTHGGYAFSAWSRKSLEEFWTEILNASMPSLATPEIVKPAETTHSSQEEDSSDMLGAMLHDHHANSNHATKEQDLSEEPDDVDHGELERPTYFAKGLAMAAVHAFYKCTGTKRMLEVWDVILTRWKDAPAEERERVQEAVDRMVKQDSIYVQH